jgi:hypothetical protein
VLSAIHFYDERSGAANRHPLTPLKLKLFCAQDAGLRTQNEKLFALMHAKGPIRRRNMVHCHIFGLEVLDLSRFTKWTKVPN